MGYVLLQRSRAWDLQQKPPGDLFPGWVSCWLRYWHGCRNPCYHSSRWTWRTMTLSASPSVRFIRVLPAGQG